MPNIQSIKNIQAKTVSTTIEIVPLTLYKQGANDLAKVQINIQLVTPLQQETKFLIPGEESKSSKVYLPDGNKAILGDFDPAAYDDIEALKPKIIESMNGFLVSSTTDDLKNTVALMADYMEYKKWSKVITIPANILYITLEYTKLINVSDETKENILETIIPLPDFSLENQQGSKCSLIVLMPLEITDQNKILESIWTPPSGNPTQLEKTVISNRQALVGYWQYDPTVRIRYKY